MNLWDLPNQQSEPPPMGRLESAFMDFHFKNPQVWEMFKKFTFELIGRGFRHYSADAVMHRIRWESTIETVSGDGFKISNNHVTFYARKFMTEHPQHKGFFRTKKKKTG